MLKWGLSGRGSNLLKSDRPLMSTDSGPSPIGHGPIELDSNIWIWLQRTPVAVAVVSLAVMCSYGPDKLLGAFE